MAKFRTIEINLHYIHSYIQTFLDSTLPYSHLMFEDYVSILLGKILGLAQNSNILNDMFTVF